MLVQYIVSLGGTNPGKSKKNCQDVDSLQVNELKTFHVHL